MDYIKNKFIVNLTNYINKELLPNYNNSPIQHIFDISEIKKSFSTSNDYFNWFLNNYKDLEYFYNLLVLEEEKNLFLKVIATKLIGPLKISEEEYNNRIKLRNQFDDMLIDDSVKRLKSATRKLKFYNVSKLGYNLQLYGAKNILDKLFIHNQYSHSNCHIEEGDFVIDAGGCWGDTSLLFAEKAGLFGQIFTFEFFQDNLDIMKDNFSLNPLVNKRIKLIEKPLYDISDKYLYLQRACADITNLKEKGLAETLSFKTISIDDFVKNNNITKIDFIKMDIEGCELAALQGSIQTLKKFKPKLAIASYHKDSDFYEISKFINELNIGYKFYFANYTPSFSDTVIYAI